MLSKRWHLKTINLLAALALSTGMLVSGCNAGLDVNLEISQGENSQGPLSLDGQMILALALVLIITVVIIAIIRNQEVL